MSEPPKGERHTFQAEISRLLHLMVHSVYSEKDVFLRELISNASDACDKLRYNALTDASLTAGDADFAIRISIDKDARTLTIADNGIGMSHDDLVDNLGTIAKSGTDAFMAALSEAQARKDEDKSLSLIGKFGVGFYSAFMVSDQVRVVSRKAGTDETWVWESDGLGEFTVTPADDAAALPGGRGTAIMLKIRDEDEKYLDPVHVKGVIRAYSNHISFPISVAGGMTKEEGAEDTQEAEEVVNSGGALWLKPKSEVSEDDYKEFYRSVAQGFDEPWTTIHYRAEGRHEYSVLLFVPTQRPFDLYDQERSGRVKLYVNRVFITAEAPLLPPYLRFVRGVIDSSDVPLTISREMLQNNPLVRTIGNGVTKRILSELKKVADKEPERYETFWSTFGAVMKEGLYEDAERREALLDLVRFRTTKSDGAWRSLRQIVDGFQENQTAIYYITGEQNESLAASPQLEGYKAKDIEVLLLSDPVDAFWVSTVQDFEGKPFKSVTRGASDLDAVGDAKPEDDKSDDATDETAMGVLIAAFKQALGEKVCDVRKSSRLRESAVCLVADDTGLDMHVEKILRMQNMGQALPSSRVLEINPDHALIAGLAKSAKDSVTPDIEAAASLLFDQALIQQGEQVSDPAEFASRLQSVLSKVF